MRSKAASYIGLLRFQDAFMATADPFAGLIVASSSGMDVFKLPYLLASSALIYAGGAALEGFTGKRRDDPERPGGPVPPGRATSGGALTLGAVLIISGILSATGAGLFPFLVAAALSASTVAYNTALKKNAFQGAAAMGASRALNLTLGMSAGAFTGNILMVLPFIIFAFVFTVSLLDRRDGTGSPRIVELSGWIAACFAIEYLLISGYFIGEGLLFAVLFHIISGIAVISAHSKGVERGAAAQSLMISIPFLDACFSSGIWGIMAGFPVAAMALPAVALSRRD